MNKRTECLSVMITKEERKALELRLYELYSKEDKKLSISDFMRGLLRANLNGNAPPPDIIDDCVKEKIVEMETEDDKQGKQWNDEPIVDSFIEQVLEQERTQDDEQDAKQLAINDSKQDAEPKNDFFAGVNLDIQQYPLNH